MRNPDSGLSPSAVSQCRRTETPSQGRGEVREPLRQFWAPVWKVIGPYPCLDEPH